MADVVRITDLTQKGEVALNKLENRVLLAYCNERGIMPNIRSTKCELVRLLINWKRREAMRVREANRVKAAAAMDNMQADLGANLDDEPDNDGDDDHNSDDNSNGEESDNDNSDDSVDNGIAPGRKKVTVNFNVNVK
jgi:hypothetical protein